MMRKVIEGDPIHVGERHLVPLVQVTGHSRRRAFVGSDHLGGQGCQFVHMRPVAILERDGTDERRVLIRDETARVIGRLLLIALFVPLLAALIVRLAGQLRD